MRILFLIAALLLLGTFAPLSLEKDRPLPAQAWVAFAPLPLDDALPDARQVGRLHYLGGWWLTSNDPRFGGISAMQVANGEVLALGDAGWIMRFPLADRGRVASAIREMTNGRGAFGEKRNRDTEALAIEGRQASVAFERADAVWRYQLPGWVPQSSAKPEAMARWAGNSGSEAMVRLLDGRFLVFAEGDEGGSEVLLFSGDPSMPGTPALRLRYQPPEGYRVTDAGLLPDGRLIILNRKLELLNGFAVKLTVARLSALKAGALISGEEVGEFRRPLVADNFEAVSVTQEQGRTILWIASDDNYAAFQRTLLLKLALEA